MRRGAVLCPVPECGAVSSRLRGVGPSLEVVCQTQGMAVLQPGWRWLCLRGQLLLASLDLALPLHNYVFNPRSIETMAGTRAEGAGVSWWWRKTGRGPVLLAPLAHCGAMSSAQGRNGDCVGSAAPDTESLCLMWPDPAERPSGWPLLSIHWWICGCEGTGAGGCGTCPVPSPAVVFTPCGRDGKETASQLLWPLIWGPNSPAGFIVSVHVSQPHSQGTCRGGDLGLGRPSGLCGPCLAAVWDQGDLLGLPSLLSVLPTEPDPASPHLLQA